MVIVVNVRIWEKEQLDEGDGFIKELLLQLIHQQKEHQFYLLTNKTLDDSFDLPANVTNLPIPVSQPLLLHKYWMDVKLPALLKKLGANVYIGTDAIASLTTRVPQCLILQDLGFLQTAKEKNRMHAYYKRNMLRFLQKAKAVIVPTALLQQTVEKQYSVPESRIKVLHPAVADAFMPLGYEVKESVKALYAQGQEYFVYKGLIHADYNLVNLLKGFSFFKKRQQSNWKLVLAGTYKRGINEFSTLLETYKYREDVFVTGPLNTKEQAEVIGSAYALINPSLAEKVNPAVWEAMQVEVPVVAAATATNKETGQDNFLYFDGNEPQDIAEKLMQIYKDEQQRRQLIERGKESAASFSWEEATSSLWQGVLQAANT
jgi:glycosyltransferase involved in cell wall biosynthesis